MFSTSAVWTHSKSRSLQNLDSFVTFSTIFQGRSFRKITVSQIVSHVNGTDRKQKGVSYLIRKNIVEKLHSIMPFVFFLLLECTSSLAASRKLPSLR